MWQDWHTENAKVDEDHEKLGRMVSSLRAVIVADSAPALVAEAIAVMRERMRLHFQMEEAVAGRADAETRIILQTDHAELLSKVEVLGTLVNRPGALKMQLDAFIKAAERHEVEVDVPLFHLLATAEPS